MDNSSSERPRMVSIYKVYVRAIDTEESGKMNFFVSDYPC